MLNSYVEFNYEQPGLTGGSDDTYVRHMLMRARSKGWRVVVFNSRGCGNSPVTTSQVYAWKSFSTIFQCYERFFDCSSFKIKMQCFASKMLYCLDVLDGFCLILVDN